MSPSPFKDQYERDALIALVEAWLDELAELDKVSPKNPYRYGAGGERDGLNNMLSSNKSMIEIGILLSVARLGETVRGDMLEARYTAPTSGETTVGDMVKIQELTLDAPP